MRTTILVLASLVVISGCSTMTPARYAVSVDNNEALKKYAGSMVRVASITAVGTYDANCRLMGPIKASDGMTIPEFIGKAFYLNSINVGK